MKVGVISDTHDNLVSMKRALGHFLEQKVDLIVHCGDWVAPFAIEFCSRYSGNIPVHGVIGNNTGDLRAIPLRNAKLGKPVQLAAGYVLELNVAGRKIAATHGEDTSVIDGLINSGSYDAVFIGHTHQRRNEIIKNTLVLNPGATCFAVHGAIIAEASVAIYNTATNAAEFFIYTAKSLYEGSDETKGNVIGRSKK